jgi:hypothetical protein
MTKPRTGDGGEWRDQAHLQRADASVAGLEGRVDRVPQLITLRLLEPRRLDTSSQTGSCATWSRQHPQLLP